MTPEQDQELRQAIAELAEAIEGLADTIREHIEQHPGSKGEDR